MLLLAAVAAGSGEPRLTLPVASNGTPDKGAHNRVVVSVDAKGYVICQGKKVTLEQLGVILRNLGDMWVTMSRAGVGKVCEKVPPSVLLRADKETPWQHVQWILTLLAEQKLSKLQFAVHRVADRAYTKEEAARLGAEWVDRAPPKKPRPAATLDASLPAPEPLVPRKAVVETKVAVHIMARKEVAAKWGPRNLPVSKPTAFEYRFGDRRCDTLALIQQWTGDAQKAVQQRPGTPLIGEISAGHKVPFKQVVAVLNLFHACGVKRVRFAGAAPVGEDEQSWGPSVPGKDVRKAKYLPYPLKNYPTPK